MITVDQSSTIVEHDPLPGETGDLSGETVELPGETVELPGETPDLPGKAPDLSGEAPDLSVETPDLSVETLDLSGEDPDLPGEAPDLPGEAPDLPGETLDLPGEPPLLPGETSELPGETREENLADLPLSLGVVGYAAFALLQPIPLDEIVPFPTVVAAFAAEAEAEAARLSTPAPVAPPAPEPVYEPQPEPGGAVPAWSPDIPLTATPETAVEYTEGGYRPSSGATWNEEFLSSAPAAVLDPADDQAQEDVESAGYKPAVTPAGQQFAAGGYAANSPSGDSRARQVLDELSFLFDK